MPTPRPAARSAVSRVEKPGWPMTCKIPTASIVSGALRPSAAALRGHDGAVDAAAVVGNLDFHRITDARGAQVDGGFGRFAGRAALRGVSPPHGRKPLRTKMKEGFLEPFGPGTLSISVCSLLEHDARLLVGVRASVHAQHIRHAREKSPPRARAAHGTPRRASCFNERAKSASVDFLQVIVGHLAMPQPVFEARAMDDDFAGDPHQVVRAAPNRRARCAMGSDPARRRPRPSGSPGRVLAGALVVRRGQRRRWYRRRAAHGLECHAVLLPDRQIAHLRGRSRT